MSKPRARWVLLVCSLLGVAATVTAQGYAVVTRPACGSTISPGTTITWSSVAAADAYYLYLGTAPGLKNLADTGEIQALSYTIGLLPAGPVYARLWTKTGGLWLSSDCTFNASPAPSATFTAPAQGATIPAATTFQWTSVPASLAYYLYVGTSPGAKDIIDTGEIQATTYSAVLPAGRQLHGRIWTKYAGGWLFDDVDFTTMSSPPAALVAPADGARIPGGSTTFQWTTSSGALAYYLYVGTAPGLKDVVDTGEVSSTSITAALPGGRQLFARLWTKFADHWDYRDAQFVTTSPAWIWPRDGARHVSAITDFEWVPVSGAQYDVTIGTVVGGGDVLNESGLTTARVSGVSLPKDADLYARIVVHTTSGPLSASMHFRTEGLTPNAWSAFAYPADGMTGIGSSTRFVWTRAANAISYYLYVGTRPGAKDVIDSGEVQNTSVDVSALPAGPLFARIWTRFASTWKYSDVAFSTSGTAAGPGVAYPSALDTQPFNADYPIEWFPVRSATAYRLQLGSATGISDLLDTGSISVTRRFVRGLTAGHRVFGRVGALVSGVWQWTSFSFTAGAPTGDRTPEFDAAFALTGNVRAMADAGNVPVAGSELAQIVINAGARTANCTHYSAALIRVMTQSAIDLPAGFVNVCFNSSNLFDCHTVVGVTDPARGMTVVLDPTMGFAPVRLSTHQTATAADIATAAAAQDFADLGFQFSSPETDAWARGYYLDYPLLYLSDAPGHSPLELMVPLGSSVSGATSAYAVQCANGAASALVDGSLVNLPCAGADHLTYVFFAGSIAPANGSSIVVWRPLRFVF